MKEAETINEYFLTQDIDALCRASLNRGVLANVAKNVLNVLREGTLEAVVQLSSNADSQLEK